MNLKERGILAEIGKQLLGDNETIKRSELTYVKAVLRKLNQNQRMIFFETWDKYSNIEAFLAAAPQEFLIKIEDASKIVNAELTRNGIVGYQS